MPYGRLLSTIGLRLRIYRYFLLSYRFGDVSRLGLPSNASMEKLRKSLIAHRESYRGGRKHMLGKVVGKTLDETVILETQKSLSATVLRPRECDCLRE